jgi:hypothetical protein
MNSAWRWVQDGPNQGRAICPTTGLALLVVWDDEVGIVYAHWRIRGQVITTLSGDPSSC